MYILIYTCQLYLNKAEENVIKVMGLSGKEEIIP